MTAGAVLARAMLITGCALRLTARWSTVPARRPPAGVVQRAEFASCALSGRSPGHFQWVTSCDGLMGNRTVADRVGAVGVARSFAAAVPNDGTPSRSGMADEPRPEHAASAAGQLTCPEASSIHSRMSVAFAWSVSTMHPRSS